MLRLCAAPRCNQPVTHRGRCATHARHHDRTPTRLAGQAIYQSKRWKVLRRYVLFASPLCPCGDVATDVDHVRPLPQPDPYDPTNLQALCHACHARKTRREQLGATA